MKASRARVGCAALIMGAMPLATVSTCGYGPGGGSFFYDHGGDDGVFIAGPLAGPGGVVVEDVVYEEDVYVEDVYYDGCYWGGCWDSGWWW